jgi:glucose-1-phosphate thymidylyltransferase
MKALILAAGYATRLYPLTETIAKPLLTIGGRPMVDHILERIREADPLEIHVVTNAKFAGAFSEWAPAEVTVHDDGTSSEDDRLGAIGDLRFVLDRAGIDHDWLVVAGDNLFDYSLADYVSWWRTKGVASAVALYEHPELELVKQYGVVELDEEERIVSFIEKPPDPVSNLAATACYVFHREHLKLVATYLDEGNVPDQPGRFVEWLHRHAPVYGYRFAGEWLDIGDRAQLLEADNRARTRAGLPPRAEYTPG